MPPAASAKLLKSFLLRVVALMMVMGTLAYFKGLALVKLLLPALQHEIHWLDDTYRIEQIFLDTEGADVVIRIVVGLARCVIVGERAFCGDPRATASASTLTGTVLLTAILLTATVFAWPAKKPFEYLWRAGFVMPALALLWALDVPFVLWAAIWGLHLDVYGVGLISPLMVWNDFLQNGGRFALAILLAMFVIWGAVAVGDRQR
jgi:hypothetical protein